MEKVLSNHRILWIIIVGLVIVIAIGGVLWWRDHNSSGIIRIKRKRADIFQVAENLYKKGEYKKALNKFTDLIFLRDSDPYIVSAAWYYSGLCKYELKRYEAARRSFEIYLKNYEYTDLDSYKKFRDARLFIAKTYIEQENKDYQQAYQGFDELAVEGISSSIQAEAMYYAAYSLKGLEAYDEALGRYTEFLAGFPNSKFVLSAYFDKGTIYANKKDYRLALTNYELAMRCVDSQNRQSELQLQIGNIYYNQLDYEKAFEVYNELLETYPRSKEVLHARRVIADIYKKKKQWDEAIEEYKGIIEEYKENKKLDSVNILGNDGFSREVDLIALSYYEISKISTEKKDFEEAFKWYAKIHEIGKIFTEKKDFEERFKWHAKIMKDFRTDPIAPSSLYNAMKALKALWDSGELGTSVELELCKILDLRPEDLEEVENEAVLKRLSDKYIAYLRVPNALWILRSLVTGSLRVEGKEVKMEHNVVDYLQNRYPGEPGIEIELELCKILGKTPEDIRKLKIREVLDHFAFNPFLSSGKAKLKNALLAAEAQLKFADIKREEFEDYTGAAAEYAKLVNHPQIPHPRLDLLKLQGKYYEGYCHKKREATDQSVEAYQGVIRLFEAIFRPLIDNPNIDVPHITKAELDYCIQISRYYVGESYFATNQFKNAIVEFEEFLKQAPNSEKAKIVRDNIDKAYQKLNGKTGPRKSSTNTSNNTNSSERSETEKSLTPQDIAKIASGSTVFIEMEGIFEYESGKRIEDIIGTGSGFYVGPGQIVTNYHVVKTEFSHLPQNKKDDDEDKVVFIYPLERGRARLVGTDKEHAIVGYTAIDPDSDLAILKVRAFDVKTLPLGNSDAVNPGEAVYPIGNPLNLINVTSDGQISSIQWVKSIRSFITNRSKLVSDVQKENTRHQLLVMTAPISSGNSGGPVLNRQGKVIGVSVGFARYGQNINYAVPVNYLKVLLERTSPPKPLSNLEIVY